MGYHDKTTGSAASLCSDTILCRVAVPEWRLKHLIDQIFTEILCPRLRCHDQKMWWRCTFQDSSKRKWTERRITPDISGYIAVSPVQFYRWSCRLFHIFSRTFGVWGNRVGGNIHSYLIASHLKGRFTQNYFSTHHYVNGDSCDRSGVSERKNSTQCLYNGSLWSLRTQKYMNATQNSC